MYYTYVLWSEPDKKFYIGYTSDLKRRLREHQSGKVDTTYRYEKIELVFYEAFLAEADARRRESYFKTSKGKKVLRLMLQESIK